MNLILERRMESIMDHAKILAQEMRCPCRRNFNAGTGFPKEGWGFAETDVKMSRERGKK